MIELYKEQWNVLRNEIGKYVLWLSVGFLASIVVTYIVMLFNEDLLFSLMRQVTHMFNNSDLLDLNSEGFAMAWGLFLNNTRACLTIFALGFIPIFILPVGALVMNGGVIGVLLAFLQLSDESVWEAIFKGLLPHGVFEIPAIIISTALSLYISVAIFKKLDGGKNYSFKVPLMRSLRTLLYVCVPLLVVAAFIEAFVTSALLGA